MDEPLVIDPELAGSPSLADRAEAVRDYLVAIRGGAPFLSSADERQLLIWLESGVPVLAIAAAIDAVAERRRRRRARGRLGLIACARELGQQSVRSVVPPRSDGPLGALVAELQAMAVPPALEGARQALCEELSGLPVDDHPDEQGRVATAAIRRFHAAAWRTAESEHPALRAQAEAALAPLRASLGDADWAELVEEQARDLVRQRTPAVSARRVWDTLTP